MLVLCITIILVLDDYLKTSKAWGELKKLIRKIIQLGGRECGGAGREGATARSTLLRVVLVVALLISSCDVSVSSTNDKCAACQAVAAEFEIGLANEKPRNHFDMRRRLDSGGQREGKVIDYRASELRVVELLDGLCDKMQDYTLKKIRFRQTNMEKITDWGKVKFEKQKGKMHSKAISTFCGRLLEETEDELSERVKKGLVQSGGVSKVLCEDLSIHCISRSNSLNVDDGEL